MKKNHPLYLVLLVVILLLNFNDLFSQSLLKLNKKNFSIKNPDFEQINKLNQNTIKSFERGEEFYNDCLGFLLEAKNICDTISVINYNIGVCYFKTERKLYAIPYFSAAISKNKNIGEDIHTLLGLCYQSNYQFDKAISHYNQKLKLISGKAINKKQETFLVRKIQECENAINLPYHQEVRVVPVSGLVNSKFVEFNPYMDGDTLYFSSIKKAKQEELSMLFNNVLYEKISKAENHTDKWENCQDIEVNILDEENVSLITRIGDKFIIYDGSEGRGDLKFAKLKGNKLKVLKGLENINNKNSAETDICFTSDGLEAYFVSDRDGGIGGSDIYYTFKNEYGNWEEAKNVGAVLNTKFDENDVFLSKDEQTLYFSSQGHTTVGGFDIFKSKKLHNGNWDKPVNMGFPINSCFNDLSYNQSGDKILFASDREGGKGKFDIYEIIISSDFKDGNQLAEVDGNRTEPQSNSVHVDTLIKKPEIDKSADKSIESTGKIFEVQIAACITSMSPSDFERRYKGDMKIAIHFKDTWKWHRYTIGNFKTFEEARNCRLNCGIKDAFIILFQNGSIESIYVSQEKECKFSAKF